ncbi:hypothetical protein [Enterovibrio calviensis]|uniref:hypothetical protein n=1 Tax=Enterovibrio calviensis TaxID=91359 RepID=UPI000483E451|nr:hypothetical protein [Enterovibrio calviensis]
MQQDETEQTDINSGDPWGNFDPFIDELKNEETKPIETIEADKPKEGAISSDAVGGLLDVAFTFVEQVTSQLAGVRFRFDEQGKTAVIEAAQPVLDKNDGELMKLFGGYVHEATLVFAVVGLVFGSKQHLVELKQEKWERENEKSLAAVAA